VIHNALNLGSALGPGSFKIMLTHYSTNNIQIAFQSVMKEGFHV